MYVKKSYKVNLITLASDVVERNQKISPQILSAIYTTLQKQNLDTPGRQRSSVGCAPPYEFGGPQIKSKCLHKG
jgi:hypothetical protein